MKKYVVLIVCFLVGFQYASAQKLNLTFDFSNAEQTIAYFKAGEVDEDAISKLLELEATQGLIQKINSDRAEAEQVLRNVFNEDAERSNYQYAGLKKYADEIGDFLNEIQKQKSEIRSSVIEKIEPFLPENKELDITVHFILGGYSSGFTLGDDRHFYIGIHHYKGDMVSIRNTCTHELFHNIQRANYDMGQLSSYLENKDIGLTYAHAFMGFIFQEGTASYIADLNKLDDSNPHIKELKEHASVNKYREQDIFYLISRLVIDVREHPDQVNYGALYNIMMSWNWNNPGYHAGYKMTEALVNEYGMEKMNEYLQKDPVFFFKDYVSLAKSGKTGLAFTDDFNSIIEQVHEQVQSFDE